MNAMEDTFQVPGHVTGFAHLVSEDLIDKAN
jgi:hypothetical protein